MKPWDLEPAMQNLPHSAEFRSRPHRPDRAGDLRKAESGFLAGAAHPSKKAFCSLRDLDAAAYDGSITGNSTVNFTDIEHVTYDGSYAVKALESSRFIADFFGAGDIVSGTFSSNLKFHRRGAGLGLDA